MIKFINCAIQKNSPDLTTIPVEKTLINKSYATAMLSFSISFKKSLPDRYKLVG